MIKTATTQDAKILAAIHVASKQKAYAGIVDADFLSAKTVEEYTTNWTSWIKDQDNPITIAMSYHGEDAVGFVCHGPLRTPPPGTSKIRPAYPVEIYAIHVHPDYWGQGHGRKLMRYAADQIRTDKKNAMCLWVLKDNLNATAFYDHLGGQRIGKRDIDIGPSNVKELCYGWRDLSILL